MARSTASTSGATRDPPGRLLVVPGPSPLRAARINGSSGCGTASRYGTRTWGASGRLGPNCWAIWSAVVGAGGCSRIGVISGRNRTGTAPVSIGAPKWARSKASVSVAGTLISASVGAVTGSNRWVLDVTLTRTVADAR
ncbi:hypothetical protein [Micromonospora arborensis]|uniref:hypothetical protein n=1 Tax=Micromonospora arborensis TaxID=2116518 RepID=UPI0011B50BAE|nr:hypothetical protein [Micromonospora arborensis]